MAFKNGRTGGVILKYYDKGEVKMDYLTANNDVEMFINGWHLTIFYRGDGLWDFYAWPIGKGDDYEEHCQWSDKDYKTRSQAIEVALINAQCPRDWPEDKPYRYIRNGLF